MSALKLLSLSRYFLKHSNCRMCAMIRYRRMDLLARLISTHFPRRTVCVCVRFKLIALIGTFEKEVADVMRQFNWPFSSRYEAIHLSLGVVLMSILATDCPL